MKAVLVALFLLFLARLSLAGDLDIRGWLGRPGTRLLAVEFYATWCEPCMKAVPRWKSLHEKYRAQGLRLVVVSTLDPEGQCVNPGWMPDETICDSEGKIAEAFGLGGRLPAAFVWSWQGNLLVSHGHVDEAARAIEAYLQKSPRLMLDPAGADAGLRDLVREQLLARGKITVLAGQAEAAELDTMKQRSFDARFDDRLQCELGQELSANSLLKVSLSRDKAARLTLLLFSAESGCLLAAGSAPYRPDSARAAVAEAVDGLLARLESEPQLPGARPDAAAKKKQADRRQAELWLEYARGVDDDELKQRALDKAVSFDPDLAAAHAERAALFSKRDIGTPSECYDEGPEKRDVCLAKLGEKKKSLEQALAALDRAVALAEGEAEYYAMRVGVLDDLQEVETMLADPEQATQVSRGYAERIRRDLDRAIALGSMARARLYDRRAALNAEDGRKEQAIDDATRAIEAKEEELARPRGDYFGQAELHVYYRNRAFRYRDAGQEELAQKDLEKARQLEEQAARARQAADQKEEREFAELLKKGHFLKLFDNLERGLRERELGMKLEDFQRLPPAAQKKKTDAIVRRLRDLARREKATAEQYLLLVDLGFGEMDQLDRDRYMLTGLKLLKAKVQGMEQALLFCWRGIDLARDFFGRERYDQALSLLDQVREVAGPRIESCQPSVGSEASELARGLMDQGSGPGDKLAPLRRIAALDRSQAECLIWLMVEIHGGELRGQVFEKLEFYGKAREEYRRLCDRLSWPAACRNQERLK
jgi:thiol-disulfide isomerase/thioredoxin